MTFAETERALDELASAARTLIAVRFLRACAGRRCAGARNFSPGSGRRPTTRSTNSSIWRSTTRRAQTPSLQGFLAWLRAAQSEVKRDMEMVRDEVRVMTVHGAKGLEANTVILADTTTPPTGPRDPRLLALAEWSTGLGDRARRRCRRHDRCARAERSRRRATNTGGCSTSR